jgi:hypothetical protein
MHGKVNRRDDGSPIVTFPVGNVTDTIAEREATFTRMRTSLATVDTLPTNWADTMPPEPSPHMSASAEPLSPQDDTLYGRRVAITATNPGTANPPRLSAVWTPMKRSKAAIWTVTLAVDQVPLGTVSAAANGNLVAYIQYMLGGVPFTKKVFLTSTLARRIPVQGRQIQVDVAWENIDNAHLAASPTTVNFSVAVEEGFLPNIEYYAPQWIRNPRNVSGGVAIVDNYQAFNGPGMLMSAFGYLTAFGAGNNRYYPMFFDSNNFPAIANLIMVGQPLTQVNQGFSFDDEFSPQVPFVTGLWVALSTTDTVYTAPGAGAQWRCDTKIGA